MNNKTYLFIAISIILVVLFLCYTNKTKTRKENFTDSTSVDVHPDINFRNYLDKLDSQENQITTEPQENKNTDDTDSDGNTQTHDRGAASQMIDLNQYTKTSNLERAARSAAHVYCPVSPDYNPNDYIKKTEIKTYSNKECPPVPDMKDYVLKSTIPPMQQCPPCICPKVKVSAGLCKKQECTTEKCIEKVKCQPNHTPVAKLKCPEPKPCPVPPVQVCPAVNIPDVSDLKCPETTTVYKDKIVKEKLNISQEIRNLIAKGDKESMAKLRSLGNIINTTFSPSELKSQLEVQSESLEDKESEIARLRNQLNQKNKQINQRNKEIEQQKFDAKYKDKMLELIKKEAEKNKSNQFPRDKALRISYPPLNRYLKKMSEMNDLNLENINLQNEITEQLNQDNQTEQQANQIAQQANQIAQQANQIEQSQAQAGQNNQNAAIQQATNEQIQDMNNETALNNLVGTQMQMQNQGPTMEESGMTPPDMMTGMAPPDMMAGMAPPTMEESSMMGPNMMGPGVMGEQLGEELMTSEDSPFRTLEESRFGAVSEENYRVQGSRNNRNNLVMSETRIPMEEEYRPRMTNNRRNKKTFQEVVAEEEAIRMHLGENTFEEITPHNINKVVPHSDHNNKCEPLTYKDRFNKYGLLGSMFN